MKNKKSYILYKPYLMLSQFTKEADDHVTLADIDFTFEKDVYPVGRLDYDSEGLLILSNDKSVNQRLLHPRHEEPKTYWAQVEGEPTEEDLSPLIDGVTIRIKKKNYQVSAKSVSLLKPPPEVPDRYPPIRVRKSIPTTWLSITLTEGKNRQVRRMLAAVGFPVLRLIRVGIAGYEVGKGDLVRMKSGDVVEVRL